MRLFSRNIESTEREAAIEYVRRATAVSAMQSVESSAYNDARAAFHESGRSDQAAVVVMHAIQRLALAAGDVLTQAAGMQPPKVAARFHARWCAAYSSWQDWAWSLVGSFSNNSLGDPAELMRRLETKLEDMERERLRFISRIGLDDAEIQLWFDADVRSYEAGLAEKAATHG